MTSASVLRDADVAISAAGAGAAVIRRDIGVVAERFEKGEGDFATAVDIEAERVILDVLHRERPDDSILAEESGPTGSAASGRRWLVDPLCGTLNYAVQMRVVAVNVALRRGSEVLCAAVADVFGDDIFWTDGRGAHRGVGSDVVPLIPSGVSRLVDLNFDPPFPSAPAFRAVALAGDPAFAARFRPRVVSSSLALAWVASGQRAAYVTDGAVCDSVHFCAGLAICAVAGCVISDLFGSPLREDSPGAIVAADGETHSGLLEIAQRLR